MAECKFENDQLKSTMLASLGALSAQGVEMHPDLIIRETGGECDLSLSEQGRASKRRSLLQVPVSCMPRLDDVNLVERGNQIHVQNQNTRMSEQQALNLEHLLTFYNQAGKLDSWQTTAVDIGLSEDSDLLAILQQRRLDAQHHKTAREKGLIESFFKSRTLSLADPRQKDKKSRVLMPLIDLLNHHPSAGSFTPRQTPKGRAIEVSPFIVSGQAFVRYSPMLDAHQSLLTYGFICPNADFVHVPFTSLEHADLPALHVRTEYSQAHKGKLGPKNIDLKNHLPRVQQMPNGDMALSKLTIPSLTQPLALRRTLATLILPRTEMSDRARLKKLIEDLERQAVRATLRYYQELGKMSEGRALTASMHHAIQALCEKQIGLIENYIRFHTVKL